MDYKSITRNDNMTRYFIEKIHDAVTIIESAKVIDIEVYSKLITALPSDLAARLRLVPDSSLSLRLAHLVAIENVIRFNLPVGNTTNYSLVSIEGSNKAIPVDCDLVLYDNDDNNMVLIDFTSSRNFKILNHKENVLLQNIELNMYKNAKSVVYKFNPRSFKIDIVAKFSSDEPGTVGLKFIDKLCTTDPELLRIFNSNCEDVFKLTAEKIAQMDNEHPPGDYKDREISLDIMNTAVKLVKTQSDLESVEFLRMCSKEDPEYFPYFDGLKTLIMNSFELKPTFPIEASKSNDSRDLATKLASLSENIWAQALNLACLTEKIVLVDEARVSLLSDMFPPSDENGFIAQPSSALIAVQRKQGHIFKIKVSERIADNKLKRVMKKGGFKKDKRGYKHDERPTDEFVLDFFTKLVSSYENDYSYFMSVALSMPSDDIWKKILTISALSSNDMNNFGRSTTTFLDSLVTTIRQTHAGASVSHFYEVCKSVLASLKNSPSSDCFYVGSNGSYDSVTITKMSSTLDSFNRCCYSVIFKPDRIINSRKTKLNFTMGNTVAKTDFYSMDPNQLSYGLRMPFYWVSLSTWEIENNMELGTISNGVIPKILMDSALCILNNRDQFAQASEQVRYFYMSSIGYGGSAPDIIEKTTFLNAKHPWELLYMMRSFKLSACLCSISSSGKLKVIEDKSTSELMVAFPHSDFPSKSFNQTISSMYICNAYNKFRAFHEVSEAICYNEILEEREIYRNRIESDKNAVSGLSPFFYKLVNTSSMDIKDYITSANFVEEEVNFALSLAVIKSNRYSGSCVFIIGATLTFTDLSTANLDSIYNSLNKAPIEACTMRGSMADGTSTGEHQGIRAASTVLEAFIKNEGMEPESVNKSLLSATVMMDRLQEKVSTFTIFSNVLEQFNSDDIIYRYRIVQKDQKGHREISVLNFNFRIGALFVETISRELSTLVGDTEIANNPNKDKIIEDYIMDSFNTESSKKGVFCYDNSDQKRWGPNHNMNYFSYSLMGMLHKDLGLMRMVTRVLDLTFDKRAKFPESLIDLITKKGSVGSLSKPINKFIAFASPKINGLVFEERIAQGMCQGIFQQTSSVVHALKTRAHSAVMKHLHVGVDLKFLATSDDAECIEFIPYGNDKINVVKKTHSTGLRIGNLFNIVRSNPKSAFNFHIAELNSIFFKKGQMATPSLKQRISKIDIGAGINHIEDYLNCLSAASNYLSSGGSYMGTVIISILNLTLHTEQWLRWGFVKSENYYKPVELGGFPVIEPITTIISGGIANFYQRVSDIMSAERYARLITNTLLCPPEEVSLSEFSRSSLNSAKVSLKAKDLTVFKGTGPLGIFQMVRTDKKLSQFERRHGISKWLIPDSFATLKRDSPLASDFLFSIFRMTSISTLDTSLGVNSFFIRMAEPWASFDRKCMRMSDSSPFKKVLEIEEIYLSHKMLLDYTSKLTIVESNYLLNRAAANTKFKPEFEIMEAQLSVRFNDAKNLREYLVNQEAESFREVSVTPSIQRVTLRGHTASDSDTYKLAVLKTLAGSKSRGLINEYKRSATAYDSFDIKEPSNPMDLVTAVIMSDNTVSLYEKFIRRDTKMILPNRVDDLQGLCIDIIRNKFSERIGMVLTGKIELDADRTKTYAYSKWYNDLIKVSEGYESSIVNSVLKGEPPKRDVVGILSSRAIVTRLDNFEISVPTLPEKTILIDVKAKDQFINQLKMWFPAKVNVMFGRETIKSFINGRLTFPHDYYIGDNMFYRHAKNKYFEISALGSKGTHTIQVTTKIDKLTNRRKLTYRHTLLFDSDISGKTIELSNINSETPDSWLKNFVKQFNGKAAPRMDTWIAIEGEKGRDIRQYRKSEVETDYVIFRKLTQGMVFKIEPSYNSLCLFITNKDLKIPITYLNPDKIEADTFKIGYTLTHSDLKKGTKLYKKLKTVTNDFDRQTYRMNSELNSAMDFILVGSTTDTPESVINKVLEPFIGEKITAIQLDILRTFLITNPKFGVSYSTTRFNHYLLNLGKRRNHKHSYLCKTALGVRDDQDSEDWENESSKEELLQTGETDPHEFNDIESVSDSPVPTDVLMEFLSNKQTKSDDEEEEPTDVLNWRQEVSANLEEESNVSDLVVQTVEEVDLFSLEDITDDEQEALEDNIESLRSEPTGNVQLTTNSINNSPVTPKKGLFDFGNDMFADIDMDNIINFEDDEQEETNEPEVNVADEINDIFTRALDGMYSNIKEDKDKGLKSEKTGHTVAANIETARSIINYLKEWISIVGDRAQIDQIGVLSKDISAITGLYALMDSVGMLGDVNLLENFFGLEMMVLPVDLSALVIVDSIYS